LQERAWFYSSNHIIFVNYLERWGPYENNCSQELQKNARNKECASLFVEMPGVHKVIDKFH